MGAVWGSQAFIKTALFLPFMSVAYFKKCHLSVTEIYKQYTWIKTHGILITTFSKPSQGFMGSHACISLGFDLACYRGLVPCCTYFRALSKLVLGNWGEKLSTKSKFSSWNRRPHLPVGFHSAEDREVCSLFSSGHGQSSSPWRGVGTKETWLESWQAQGSTSLTGQHILYPTPLS